VADETTAVIEEALADGVTESMPPEAASTDPPTKRRADARPETTEEAPVVCLDEDTTDVESSPASQAAGDDEAPPAAIRPIARLGGDPDVPGTQLDYRPNSAPNLRAQPQPPPHTIAPVRPRERAGPVTVDAVAFPRSTDRLPSFADQLEAWVRRALDPPVPPTLDDPELR
jgi:hypothetical protein